MLLAFNQDSATGMQRGRRETMRLADKVIFVTGAASGMGRVASRMFAEQGARVIAADVNEAGLSELVHELPTPLRTSVLPVAGSVASSDDVKRMIDAGVAAF